MIAVSHLSSLPGMKPTQDGCRLQILDENDIPLVQELMEKCEEFFLLVGGLPPAEDEGRKIFCDLPNGKDVTDKTVFGLFYQGELAGVIDSIKNYPEESCWFIGLFLLRPDQRGQGIGRRWLGAYLDHAMSNGAVKIRLGVVEQNAAGRRFWEKNGFSMEARRPPVRYGAKDCVVLLMRRELYNGES